MKRKIIHIYWQLTSGGIETMLVNIANAQADAGADVTVIIVNDLYDEPLLDAFSVDVNVVRLHKKPYSGNPSFIFRLNREVHRIRPDVIHLHSSKLYGLIFGRRLKRRCCCTLHNVPVGRAADNGWLHRLCPLLSFRQSGNVQYICEIPKVFAISELVRKMLSETCGIDSTVVVNGIRTGDFALRPPLPPKAKLRIVQVSRLEHEHKGQDLLIEAVARLEGHVEVDFVGTGESMDYLRRLAETMGVVQYVHFLGNRTQRWINEHLCTYDLLIQPSRYEGFGLTVAEAMASRLPVLVSAGQGTAEITCGEEYGWLFRNGDVEDLARMIRYIQGHYDEALLKAERACTYVKETYDVSVTARRYLEAYETLH